MARWKSGLVLSLSIAFAGIASFSSGETVAIATKDESIVRIRIDRVFETYGGYLPLRIGIQNRSGRARSWTFHFVSFSGVGSTRRSSFVFDVPSGEERRFDVIVPLASTPGDPSPLNVRVLGYAVEMPTWDYPVVQYGYGETDPSIALSQSLHAETGLGVGQAFDAALLPSDWRGLLSLRTLVLTEDELREAPPEARIALQEWTARGGHLVRVGSDEAKRESLGLGIVVKAPRPGDSAGWEELLRPPGRPQGISYPVWAGATVQAIETHAGLLLLFLVGYALLVAPVNLFVFCARGKRARLFWTMPALALGASAFLTVIVLFQDGLGGSGSRVTFVRLVPELTREVVVQEQVSRTGALLNRSFEMVEPVALFDVAVGGAPFTGELRSAAGSFGGTWFRSRAVQAQRIELVRAGRARIEWAGENRIHSSIESPLDELFYRADDGSCWRAAGVTAGGEVSLEPVAEAEYERFWQALSWNAGPVVRDHLYASYWERGAFLARGRASSSAPIETLRGIAWEDTVIYSGRIGGER